MKFKKFYEKSSKGILSNVSHNTPCLIMLPSGRVTEKAIWNVFCINKCENLFFTPFRRLINDCSRSCMLQPSPLRRIFLRIYFRKSDFPRARELPLIAEGITLLLNKSPGPIWLAQNCAVLRGRDDYEKDVVLHFLLQGVAIYRRPGSKLLGANSSLPNLIIRKTRNVPKTPQ